jgi:hypothetical protein
MGSIYDDKPADFSAMRTRPLQDRAAKVALDDFAREYQPGEGLNGWLASLPRILAANSLAELVAAMCEARRQAKPIIWGLGGHVVKCGLASVLLGLMRRGFLTAIAMNGSAAIHDSEIALCGSTSEEVEEVLSDGSFGTAEETGRLWDAAARTAVGEELGLGEALGRHLPGRAEEPAPTSGAAASLLAGAYQARVPVTVHVAMGTDTVHLHPRLDPAALGAASHCDFRLFCRLVGQLEGGGVYLNVGSAVVLPEVFLKAVSAVRNLGGTLAHFYTANLDFLQHYRPNLNVVRRPTALGGKGWAITGHHEIMVPLLGALLTERC